MNQKNKIIFLSTLIIGVLTLTLGVTFAVFNFSKTSTNSQLVVGDIYMHYNETNQITLENAMPLDVRYQVNTNMTEEELNLCVSYLTNIWGDEEEGNTVNTGETYAGFCNGTGTNFGYTFQELIYYKGFTTEQLIYFENNNIIKSAYSNLPYFEFTVDGKNTTTDKDIWYDIVLTHGDDHETRTTRIRDDLLRFRLVEVVDSEEVVLIDNNKYNDLTSKRIWIDTISKDTTNEVTHTYRLYMWIDKNIKIGNVNQDYTMEEWNDVYASIKVNVTGDFNVKSLPTTDESCFAYQEIEGGIEINYYDKSCGTDVIIPDEIDGLNVISVTAMVKYIDEIQVGVYGGFSDLRTVVLPKNLKKIGNYAFYGSQLTNITIPDSVITIEDFAFYNNQLTNVIIPDSVTAIGTRVFLNNQLTSVTIGNGIQYISRSVFNKDSSDSNPNLISITINKSCSDIKDIPSSSTSSTKYYPWLAWKSPYTASGVTIYGAGGEVCDSY